MPVSAAMVDALALQPGMRVLELAAGPGDTGFMAAELISPGGTLISSDGAEAMLEVARRAGPPSSGVHNVEFQQLELEWIDLETATVDAVLCRWGIMLIVDPVSAAREIRRILRSGGRAAFAVWDAAERNPWATIPSRVMIEHGHAPAAGSRRARSDVQPRRRRGPAASCWRAPALRMCVVTPVALERRYDAVERYVEETIDMSPMFSSAVRRARRRRSRQRRSPRSRPLPQPFVAADGTVLLPGSSLVASAGA